MSGKERERSQRKTESRRPETSPPHLTLHSLYARRPQTILTADQRTRASSTLGAPPTGTQTRGNRVRSRLRTPRHIHSRPRRGSGRTDKKGTENKGKTGRSGGGAEGKKTQFMDIGEGSGWDNWYAWLISNIFYYWLQQCAPRATFIQRASGM